MSPKRCSPEEIIIELRKATVLLFQGKKVRTVLPRLGIAEQLHYVVERERSPAEAGPAGV